MAVVLLQLAVALAAVAMAPTGSNAALVEHTFVVSQVKMKHLGKETLTMVVNGQLPGPAIEVSEGDSLAVNLINKSPYGITIHWHGVKQPMNCWNDGVGMITQCPIEPGKNFTYRFNVAGQEGTLWWHAHVACLRGTIHGALIIRPRSGPDSYPFSIPDEEIPIIIGEWWEMDLVQLDRNFTSGNFDYYPKSATINGKLGDLSNFSGVVEDSYVLKMQPGKTYLLRIVNAALLSEYYFKIAGHGFTVVAADANYVKPYDTDTIAIAPGETVDALVVAGANSGSYYMVALANQPPKPDDQSPLFISRGVVLYDPMEEEDPSTAPVVPQMPDQHDTITSFYFRGNLTGLPHPLRPSQVKLNVDEHMFITLSLGIMCREDDHRSPCNMNLGVANMNNISFQLPTTTALLEAKYYSNSGNISMLHEFPDKPLRFFNFTDPKMIVDGENGMASEPTVRATSARRFRYNTSVEVVFQSTSVLQSDSNPMHLHGHDFFILAQGLGDYNPERDVKRYNVVDPPVRNTVLVPNMGWAAIRFVTDNPGVWYMHCHYEFHVSMGMSTAFIVENGPTLDTTLPPPPIDFPRCHKQSDMLSFE